MYACENEKKRRAQGAPRRTRNSACTRSNPLAGCSRSCNLGGGTAELRLKCIVPFDWTIFTVVHFKRERVSKINFTKKQEKQVKKKKKKLLSWLGI
ncbi:hypothetical protein PUN28_004543 [Cardiocondyla obscurior]|uniref:Uncharacterized protein n=1 Tax=Cardiocondyla obscurior TaxID=286306 RepID=A0AAW2GF90_9HYME